MPMRRLFWEYATWSGCAGTCTYKWLCSAFHSDTDVHQHSGLYRVDGVAWADCHHQVLCCLWHRHHSLPGVRRTQRCTSRCGCGSLHGSKVSNMTATPTARRAHDRVDCSQHARTGVVHPLSAGHWTGHILYCTPCKCHHMVVNMQAYASRKLLTLCKRELLVSFVHTSCCTHISRCHHFHAPFGELAQILKAFMVSVQLLYAQVC